MTTTPCRGAQAASAGTLRLTLRARLRFQSQRRPRDTRGTLAKAPGQRPELSIRRRRHIAEPASEAADRHPRCASSHGLSRSRRLRSKNERHRRLLPPPASGAKALGRPIPPRRVDEAAAAISVVVTNPVGQIVVGTGLVAALRRKVEAYVRAQQLFGPASVG